MGKIFSSKSVKYQTFDWWKLLERVILCDAQNVHQLSHADEKFLAKALKMAKCGPTAKVQL